jgi:hypothetical protein
MMPTWVNPPPPSPCHDSKLERLQNDILTREDSQSCIPSTPDFYGNINIQLLNSRGLDPRLLREGEIKSPNIGRHHAVNPIAVERRAHAVLEQPYASRPHEGSLDIDKSQANVLGRLPMLQFNRYSLSKDFLMYSRDFNNVADAHNALDSYKISQFRNSLLRDAKNLFESRMEELDPITWKGVMELARKVFMPQD